eukprot:JP439131.1.p3 GENE.JP439131.1~~JP439131.1.p3  ORF type:complete len:80 (+),score=8.00 JP439131.1:140-379(+)
MSRAPFPAIFSGHMPHTIDMQHQACLFPFLDVLSVCDAISKDECTDTITSRSVFLFEVIRLQRLRKAFHVKTKHIACET